MKLNDYQTEAVKTAFFPMDVALMYIGLGVAGEAGEVAEKIKKVVRDKNGYLSQEDRTALSKEIGDVLWYLANLCEYMGTDLQATAEMNLEKLQSRKARGKLQGSGDNR